VAQDIIGINKSAVIIAKKNFFILKIINYLLEKTTARLEKIIIPKFKTYPALTEWRDKKYNKQIEKTIRIIPELQDTGGFFIAKIKKC